MLITPILISQATLYHYSICGNYSVSLCVLQENRRPEVRDITSHVSTLSRGGVSRHDTHVIFAYVSPFSLVDTYILCSLYCQRTFYL